MDANYEEEQSMEVEALASIYEDAFKVVGRDPLRYDMTIVPGQDEDFVEIVLHCAIPPTYPDVLPKLEMELVRGLSSEQLGEMEVIVEDICRENEGMAMVFSVVEAVKEYLVENNQPGNDGSEYQEMLRRAKKVNIEEKKRIQQEIDEDNANAEDEKKVEGTPVTSETFQVWKDAFDKENIQNHGWIAIVETTDKLCGRQQWLQGLAGNISKHGEGGEESEEEGKEEEDESNSEDDE